jgi:NitT/TauT family transport system substrate-binding protein
MYNAGPAIVQAFAQNQIQIGYLGVPPLMIGIDKGVPMKAVASTHVLGDQFIARKEDGYKDVYEMGGDELATIRQFKGKKIGIPPRGSIEDAEVRDLVRRAGMKDGEDIFLVNYNTVPSLPDLLEEREIDAMVVWPPFNAVSLSRGNTEIIIDAQHLWWNAPCCCLAIHTDLTRDYPDFVREFVKIHVMASRFIMMYPDVAADFASKELKLDKKIIMTSFDLAPRYCAKISEDYIQASEKFSRSLYESGYAKNILTREEIFDLRFINDVHPEKEEEGVGKVPKEEAVYKFVMG